MDMDIKWILEEVWPMAKLSEDKRDTLVLTNDWDGEDIYIWLCDCFLSDLIGLPDSPIREVVCENPDLCLNFGVFGKEIGGCRIESGIFTFEDHGYLKVSRIGNTDKSVLIIPHQIHYNGFTEKITGVSVGDENPVSPSVREIILSEKYEAGECVDLDGKFFQAFPSLQRIVNSRTASYDFSFGNPSETCLLFAADEEIEAIRNTPKYQYRLFASENDMSLEEAIEELGIIKIIGESYWIKSRHFEGFYNVEDAELRIDRVFDLDTKEILIPEIIRIMGREFPVREVDIDGSELEVVWLPKHCKLVGSILPKKAFCFYENIR